MLNSPMASGTRGQITAADGGGENENGQMTTDNAYFSRDPADRPCNSFPPRPPNASLFVFAQFPASTFGGRFLFFWPPSPRRSIYHERCKTALPVYRVGVLKTKHLARGKQNSGESASIRWSFVSLDRDPRSRIKIAGAPSVVSLIAGSKIRCPRQRYSLFTHYKLL